MKIIGWDTSTKTGTIVALEVIEKSLMKEGSFQNPFRLLSQWTLNLDAAQHSERLLWGIHHVLESCGWSLKDIDAFGVGVGPGSFTGLRIGLTTAKTLAWTQGKKIIPISSLLALSRQTAEVYASTEDSPLIIVTQDAAKGELFALWGKASSQLDCIVKSEGDFAGYWKRGVEEEVITPVELEKEIKRKLKDNQKWIALGEGRMRYPELWNALPKEREIQLLNPAFNFPNGASLAQLFWQASVLGLFRDPLSVIPRYLREADAERKLKAGLLGKK